VETVERFDPEGALLLQQAAQRGVEIVQIARARNNGVKNGWPAKISPCIGIETEAERGSG
jgi:hypothetical protein